MRRPAPSEYVPENAAYVNLVPEGDIISAHEQQLAEVLALLGPVAEEVGNVRDAPTAARSVTPVRSSRLAESRLRAACRCPRRGKPTCCSPIA